MTAGRRSAGARRPVRDARGRRLLTLLALACAALLVLPAAQAVAGQASSGELLFYPCASCHPVRPGARVGAGLPNGFKGHGIVLEGHDALGRGDAACLACHDDPAKDPGKLKTADGGLVGITGDVARVCYRCHSAKYREWRAGTHGKGNPACTSAGCHDPHTPGFIYAEPLLPFTGSGFQFKAVSGRQAFSPLAPPPPAPPVETPWWLVASAAVGAVVAGGLAGTLVMGRSKR